VGKVTSLLYSDRTDIGRRRSNNQDAKAVLPATPQEYRGRGWFFVVADGMGAHAAGELASAMAADRLPKLYEQRAEFSPPLALKQSLERVNAEIHAKGESGFEFRGMGTTCTALVILPRGALVGHVGDSRCYRVRGRTIEQLSRDHSLVWELEAAGGMSREQAADAAPKNIITRSMGPHAQVDCDLEGPFPVSAGDTFVLCSDGLSGQVGDAEIGLLAASLEPDAATAALVGLSLARGAPDNVTVIVVRAGEEEATRPSRNEAPWPLSEQAISSRQRARRSWLALATAAGFLLAALMFNPYSLLTKPLCDDSPVMHAACLFGSIAALLVGGAALLAAVLGFLAPAGKRARMLRAGDVLGKAPYRRYDCTPNERLLEGILASLESASGELSGADAEAISGHVGRARQLAGGGTFTEAVAAAAQAIAVHTKAVETARRDDTIRGPAAPPSPA
jgi:protein phosphatase